ncbi:MAG: twin-arginine translocase TatA/TatE family subunit [Actinomycetota bacterium]
MFNLSGSEIVFLLIIGLVVLGPEKLPAALRKAGRLYGEFRRITSGAESEFRSAFAEPLREFQDTASEYKAMFTNAASGVAEMASEVKSAYHEGATGDDVPSSSVESDNDDEVIDGK